jgi:hypothetical protein
VSDERDDEDMKATRCRMCDRMWPRIPCPECGACIDCLHDDCATCVKRLEFFDAEAKSAKRGEA